MCEAFRVGNYMLHRDTIEMKSQLCEIYNGGVVCASRNWNVRYDPTTNVLLPNCFVTRHLRHSLIEYQYHSKTLNWCEQGQHHCFHNRRFHNNSRDPETGRGLPAVMTLLLDFNLPTRFQLSWWTFGVCSYDWASPLP